MGRPYEEALSLHLSIEGDEGHVVGVTEIQKVGEQIRRFLNDN